MLATAAICRTARADHCRLVDISFVPTSPNLQIAVWIEDTKGQYIDTAFVTRATGALGLGNRPGIPLFKSSYRWPYGAREMVLPIWAHARNHVYPLIVMGGADGTDPWNDSVGFHEDNSSPEPFFCAPSQLPLDAMSCASPFNSSKGLFAPNRSSLYPPRADLAELRDVDSADARSYATLDDLAAISGATPPANAAIDPPILWSTPPGFIDGDYVVRVEASLEEDFDGAHRHPATPDRETELRSFGYEPFGQPSIVYSAPIRIDGAQRTSTSDGWDGYSTWDGSDGVLHAPDATIVDVPGSGAGRLAHTTDASGTWRLRVGASDCKGCATPSAPSAMSATPAATTAVVKFLAPPSTGALDAARRYDVRFRAGPLDDASFSDGIPAGAIPPPSPAGTLEQVTLTGLKPSTLYTVGVRSVNACGAPSSTAWLTFLTTQAQYVTLSGCFVATAAFGSQLEPQVAMLRAFRDRVLLQSPLGRLSVAIYYSLSPPLAHAIAADERLRALARRALAPVVTLARAWLLADARAR